MDRDPSVLTRAQSAELQRRRRGRNIAMLVALLGLCVLFYLISVAKLAHLGGAG